VDGRTDGQAAILSTEKKRDCNVYPDVIKLLTLDATDQLVTWFLLLFGEVTLPPSVVLHYQSSIVFLCTQILHRTVLFYFYNDNYNAFQIMSQMTSERMCSTS
jgi:hypothetical protein